jgi:hypothetical protein
LYTSVTLATPRAILRRGPLITPVLVLHKTVPCAPILAARLRKRSPRALRTLEQSRPPRLCRTFASVIGRPDFCSLAAVLLLMRGGQGVGFRRASWPNLLNDKDLIIHKKHAAAERFVGRAEHDRPGRLRPAQRVRFNA